MKKNGLYIVVFILVIITIGLVLFICYDKGLIFSKESNNINNTNNSSNTNNTKEIKELDLEKSLNTKDITYKNASDTEGNYGLSIKINNEKTATLTIDWKIFGRISTTGSSGEVKDYLVKGFNKNIKSTFIGNLGQDTNGITLFFIMEDGTVEYVKVFKMETNDDGSTYYILNNVIKQEGNYSGEFTVNSLNVSGVIKLYNVDAYSKNASGYRTVIGATKDGSFYDLGSIIK